MNYEHISFDHWKKWTERQLPSCEFDVPEDFGLFGVYILGNFSTEPEEKSFDPQNIPKEVFYIGMSRHVDQRLAKAHKAVKKYREATGDQSCKNLWFVKANSDWPSRQYDSNVIASSYMEFYERALILSYVLAHNNLPAHNAH